MLFFITLVNSRYSLANILYFLLIFSQNLYKFAYTINGIINIINRFFEISAINETFCADYEYSIKILQF
jgi:hypothetical protein